MKPPRLIRLSTALFVCALAIAFSSCTMRSALPTPNAPSPLGPGMASATFVMHWPASSDTFVMHWPASTSSASSGRQPRFISPSTQSVTISVNGLTPTVVNRPSGGSVPTTNITIVAPVGTDTFSIKLYDQQGGAGNLLGQTALSKTIVANTANTISATVNGVLAKIALGPAAGQHFVEGNAIAGFILVGEVVERFIATPQDADGNAILTPGVVPVVTLASGSPNLKITPTTPTNQFLLQFIGPLSTPATLLGTAAGTSVSATFTIAQSAALYSANFDANTVTVYDQNGNQITTSSTFPNLNLPAGIAFDPANGRLYVSNFNNNTITVYDQNGNQITPSGTFPHLSEPLGLAFDPANGQLYVTNFNNNTITVYDQNGNQITPSGTFPNLSGPTDIAFDPANGQLYVTNFNNKTVTVYNQIGNQITPLGTFPNLNQPQAIAFDPANALLYVGNAANSTMTVYDQNGNQIATSGTFPNLNMPQGIAFDPANALLYVGNSNATMTVYDQNGNPIGTTGNFPNLFPARLTAVP